MKITLKELYSIIIYTNLKEFKILHYENLKRERDLFNVLYSKVGKRGNACKHT